MERESGPTGSQVQMPTALMCPSSQPDRPDSVVIGVVSQGGGTKVAHLQQVVPVNFVRDLIPETIPITAVVRVASTCAEGNCRHFTGRKCSLASRIVAGLPEVVERLSACTIRSSCRWWHQEGPAACYRCPQIVTEPLNPSNAMREVATPHAQPER